MKRIAAPMVGGIFTSFILELLVYPAIYEVWRWNTAVKRLPGAMQYTPEAVGRLGRMPQSQTVNVAGD